jgi:hypothetical protein
MTAQRPCLMGTSTRVFYEPWPALIWNRRTSVVNVKFRPAQQRRERPKGAPVFQTAIEPGGTWYFGCEGFPLPSDQAQWGGRDVWIT